MADTATTIRSERWLDEVNLQGNLANVGADVINEFLLPPGLGDVALMNIVYAIENIATLVTPTNLAFQARLLSAADDVLENLGPSTTFRLVSATRATAILDPDALVLWRHGEKMQLFVPELDSNAVPTDDHQAWFKVVRVRPIESALGPIRLVR